MRLRPACHRAFREEAEGEARRGADGLLRPGEEDVDPPLVESLVDAAGRADAVEDEELGAPSQDLDVRLDRRERAGGGVDVADRHGGVGAGREAGRDLRGRNGLAPLRLQDLGLDPEGGGEVAEAVAEVAVGDDEDLLAGRHEVDEGDLHRERPASRDDEGLAGLAPAESAEAGERLAELLHEGGEDVGRRRAGQGAEDSGVDRGRSRDHGQRFVDHGGLLSLGGGRGR